MSEPDPSRPGSVLKAEREALGVTVREVAETLNLSITVIQAIEDDDLDRLPGTVFARGYVRAYARLLELDPKPLMAEYPEAPKPTPLVEGSTEPPIWEWIRRRPALVLGGAAGVMMLVLVMLVLWLWPEPRQGLEGRMTATGAAEDVAAGQRADAAAGDWIGEDAGTDMADRESAPLAGSALAAEAAPSTADGAAVTDVAGAVGAGADDVQVAAGPEAGPPPASGNVRRITATGDDRLALTFSDDCWVEVRRPGGGNLYSDLNRADSELVLVGQGPFRILLGYAPGVRLSFNGEPVPLVPHTRNNVATLVLGQ